MKNIKISSFIFMLIGIFLIINMIGYKVLYNNIESSHEMDTKILFHDIKDETSDLLAKLIHYYKLEKPLLLAKHQIAEEYMNNHDLNVSLDELYELINAGHMDSPYDIYITDKNLTIFNTTYKNDLGFNLTFAKDHFEKHQFQNIIGCSFPIREVNTYNFLSYSDSYLSKNGDDRAAVLEISYMYKNISKGLRNIENIIMKNPIILDMKAYSFGGQNFVYDMMLKKDASYKYYTMDFVSIQKKAKELSKKLHHSDLKIEYFSKKGKHYQRLYMLTQSPISEDLKIVYTLLLNDDNYYAQLNHLNLFMFLSLILGFIAIFIITKVRDKEIKLSDQDKFVQSAMHEIKTPLSIITLNNELRQLEQGRDSYSEEIDNALKVLHNSYRSMSFIMTKDKLAYEIETLNLRQKVEERIEYFQTIALLNNKKIIFDLDSHCRVKLSLIELTRLIDNSLYNALKYSAAGSDIKVVLTNNILSFHNQGEAIENKEKVFNKYFRENNTVGGYGLGLSIIKDIADKYDIGIELQSDTNRGTIFTYVFKCHTNDIS
ncbi:MAG: HAMP domain-containing sensor histidine kinase [Campylobacterota bacterium]|nr:HAMP domain-containing sensor histidine kinase [Campylobacterota bacterium]